MKTLTAGQAKLAALYLKVLNQPVENKTEISDSIIEEFGISMDDANLAIKAAEHTHAEQRKLAATPKASTFLFRLPTEWRKQLKIIAADNETSIQKLIENALNSDPLTAYVPEVSTNEKQATLC